MTKPQEPWGPTHSSTIAGILSGLLVAWLQNAFSIVPPLVGVFVIPLLGLLITLVIHYHKILGGSDEPLGSQARTAYDRLRQNLAAGGTPAKTYADWLGQALDRVDHFFGDAGRDDHFWLTRIIGLETPGARWTAPAFDRCLLLALLYPIATIFAVWVAFGHGGVAEHALGLARIDGRFADARRWLAGVSLVFSTYAW